MIKTTEISRFDLLEPTSNTVDYIYKLENTNLPKQLFTISFVRYEQNLCNSDFTISYEINFPLQHEWNF